MPPRCAKLEDVLAYKNPEVVNRFLESYPIDPADAEDIFTETKRWLWLVMAERSHSLGVTMSMFAIDEMWHAFLMYTKDYEDFCLQFFGEHIHHYPTPTREKLRTMRRAQMDPEGLARSHARRMARQYRHIARHLGEETLRKWYLELAEKYSAEKLRRIHAQALLAQSLSSHGGLIPDPDRKSEPRSATS